MREYRKMPAHKHYREDYGQWLKDNNRCFTCSAPLAEEEKVYCVNCSMHLLRNYPSKAERGSL